MSIDLHRENETTVIAIKGKADIILAGSLLSALNEAMEATSCIRLDLRQVAEVDLTFIQLVCSAHKTALEHEKKIEITGPIGKEVCAKFLTMGVPECDRVPTLKSCPIVTIPGQGG